MAFHLTPFATFSQGPRKKSIESLDQQISSDFSADEIGVITHKDIGISFHRRNQML